MVVSLAWEKGQGNSELEAFIQTVIMDLNGTEQSTLEPFGSLYNESSTEGGVGDLGNVASFDASTVVDTIYIAIGCIGMLGNTYVILVMLSGKGMLKKITNLCILNQSALDLLVSLVLSCTIFTPFAPSGSLLAEFLCRFWDTRYPLWSFLISSTYNLVLITLERFYEVVHPIQHKVSFTRKRAAIALVFVWILGFISQSYFFLVSAIADGVCWVYSFWPSELARRVFGVMITIFQFIIPLIVIVYVYTRIIYVINVRIKVSSAPQDAPGGNKNKTTSRGSQWKGARRNTMKTMAIVAAAFVMCWIQNQVYYLMMNLGYPPDFSSPYYHFTVVCVFSNCCINPFIYALKYREFQAASRNLLRKVLPCLIKPTTEEQTSDTSSAGTEHTDG